MDERQARASVEELFDSWYPQLLRYASRLCSIASAEELAQEVFLDYYKALIRGQSIGCPKAWTLCVCRHKAAEWRRSRFGPEQPHEDLELVAGRAAVIDNLDAGIDARRLRGFYSLLSDREEEVLVLRLHSLKYQEIARELGISESSVNTLLARALKKLRKAAGLLPAKPGLRGPVRRKASDA